jgi:hypothetical protein
VLLAEIQLEFKTEEIPEWFFTAYSTEKEYLKNLGKCKIVNYQ